MTAEKPKWASYVENVPANPAQIQWPMDQWGITSDLRKALIQAAGSIKGVPDKHELILATIMVGLAHIKARRGRDQEILKRRVDEIKAAAVRRQPLERFHTYNGDK